MKTFFNDIEEQIQKKQTLIIAPIKQDYIEKIIN